MEQRPERCSTPFGAPLRHIDTCKQPFSHKFSIFLPLHKLAEWLEYFDQQTGCD